MSTRHIIVIAVTVLSSAVLARAGIVSYEGTAFPETEGWERTTTLNPERWLEDGWLVQRMQPIGGGLPGGGRDGYQRSLNTFIGVQDFFVEWRVFTTGPRTEIDGVAPASLVIADDLSVLYHFTMASDQVRLLRDTSIPSLRLDIDPSVPHTYRLDLFGDEEYVWRIDGAVVDRGVPEGIFPISNSVISWRASSWFAESTTQWDYIRYGAIPEPATGLLCLAGAAALVRRRTRR